MFSHWLFYLKRLGKSLSLRAALFAVFAVIASLAAVLISPYLPDKITKLAGGDAVDNILTMMASTMLVVVTFSMQTMVAAYSVATQNATPRSTTLVIEDDGAQNAISIFLGAFIYSVVSMIALSTGYYTDKAKAVVLIITVGVLTAVVWKVIKWLGQLREMGRVSENIHRIEAAGIKAFTTRARVPNFGCQILANVSLDRTLAVHANSVGHVQNIDVEALGKLAEDLGLKIYIEADVGSFVHTKSVIARLEGFPQGQLELFEKIRQRFSIGPTRTFENDPRYCLTVLSGIALHALSPSLNDPGTAVDVIGSLVRVLTFWSSEKKKFARCPSTQTRLFMRPLRTKDLVEDCFYSIARDASTQLDVAVSLQVAIQALTELDDEELQRAAIEQGELALRRVDRMIQDKADLAKFLPFRKKFEGQELRH